MDDGGAITGLLRRMSAGEAQAEADLLPLVYAQLHALAARYLRGERDAHTLSPTALVNEAWLRLASESGSSPADRRDYFAIAARRMRQVLVDHARHRQAAKRDGGQRESAITLSSLATPKDGGDVDALALDQALQRLEALDARKARVVELRYFAGLTMDEVAAVLDISRATAQRDWEVARTFLFQALR